LKNNKDVFIINAVHGLGEALMSEEVMADHYEFDIKRQEIVKQNSGNQTHWRSPESPHMLRPMPHGLLGKPILNKNQVKQIVHMAQRAKDLFHIELDIEWAYEDEKLFLLQVRPITGIVKKREFELWTRDNVADVIPDAVTPLTWSVVEEATNGGFERVIIELGVPHQPTDLFKIFDGRAYFNQTAYRKILDLRSENSKVPVLLSKICYNYLRLLFTLRNKVSNLEQTFSEGLSATIVESRVSTIKGIRNYLSKYMATHILVAVLMDIGFLFIRRLMSKSAKPTEVSSVIDGLVIGLNEIESIASRAGLWQLACLIREDEKLAETIQNSPVQSVPDILKTSGGVCADRWHDFLDLYGHSSLREFEIYYPRWKDAPGFVAATLKNYIAESSNIDLKVSQRIREERRRESEQTLLKMSPLPCRPLLRYYTKHVQQCTIWRESIKQKIVKIMAEIRTQVTGFARDKGIKPDDAVFFLTLSEIAEYENDPIPPHIIEEIDRRRNQWKTWGEKKPFREIRVFGNGQTVRIPHLTRSGNKIQGLGLSSGKYMGRARIVLDPNDVDSFNMGDILVTRSTNPNWTPLFTLAGAIVTDMGNYLSHGAIVARELGIPAVGNLFDATKRIRNGQVIAVDGDSGIVQLSEDENS
jgi:pyruvate,water dikinase